MDCDTAREALSARIDGEREHVPAARVDEHLNGCRPCSDWHAAAVEQTQLLRRLAGRSQVTAVRPLSRSASSRRPSPIPWPNIRAVHWSRWSLGLVGVIQILLAVAQGLGVHLGLPHTAMGGHVLNESTAWSAALGVAMVAAAFRPAAAGGLTWVLAAFTTVLSVYVVNDAIAGRVSLDRILTHLPVLAAAALAWLVCRQAGLGGRSPDRGAAPGSDEIVLPPNASPGRRRSHLRSSDGSAA